MCRSPDESGGPNSCDIVGRDQSASFNERLVATLEAWGFMRSSGNSSGMNIPGNVGNVAGDMIGGNKVTVVVQGIDAEISDIPPALSGVSEAAKGYATPGYSIDEKLLFERVQDEAEKMSNAGRDEEASRAFMEALDREDQAEQLRRQDHRRRRIRLLEAAIVYDKKAGNADAAFEKLRNIAQTINANDDKAQAEYLSTRGSKYQEEGKLKGDNAALLIAVEVFKWLAKDKIDVE